MLSSGVLIPSFRRPDALMRCLASLSRQTRPPGHVAVIWQADDFATRDAAENARVDLPFELRVIHSAARGVVPAENAGLEASNAQIILLIDDDATAPRDWIARHMAFYDDPTVGAVGGPAVNHNPDGTPFPIRAREPIGRLSWFGRTYGNMYDLPASWSTRAPTAVDHLVGYNMSIRRTAIDRFADSLREYWQMFELEACLQVKARGFRVMFDFGNVIEHYPTNTAYAGGRDGDLQIKVFNPAYNSAWILARHSPSAAQRWARLAFLLGVGTVGTPGLLGSVRAIRRFGYPAREMRILRETLGWKLRGWREGSRARRGTPE